jgi:hypothetical protein
MRLPIMSENPAEQKFYEEMRGRGMTHLMAEMLALRAPPGLATDATFLAGRGHQFANRPELGDYYSKDLKAAGGSPVGKQYLSGLAAYPGDPEAWVDSRRDVQQLCEKRGWSCSGMVQVSRNPECVDTRFGDVGLDTDIVDDAVLTKTEDNPGIADTPQKKERLWNETYDHMKPPRTNEKRPDPPR